MKITLDNVQSIHHAEIEIDRGKLTVIEGQTNSGKTAIFRGIEDLLLNIKEAKQDVCTDALKENPNAEMRVSLIDDNKNTFEYVRTTSSAKYVINGNDYGKLNRKNLYDLPDVKPECFLYDPTDGNRQTSIINMHVEDERLFMFDRSDAERFKLFEKMFPISNTSIVLKAMQLDEVGVNHKITELSSTIDSLNNSIDKIDEIVSMINVEYLQSLRDALNNMSNYINILNQDYSLCLSMITQINNITNIDKSFSTTCSKLDLDVDFSLAKSLQVDYHEAIKLHNYINAISSVDTTILDKCELLDAIDTTEISNDIVEALKLVEDIALLNDVSFYKEQMSIAEKELSKIKVCPMCSKPLKKGETLCQ
jgi:DNA repair ATPase RecN